MNFSKPYQRGRFVLSKAAGVKTQKAVLKAANAWRLKQFILANTIYDQLMVKKKAAKRGGFNWEAAFQKISFTRRPKTLEEMTKDFGPDPKNWPQKGTKTSLDLDPDLLICKTLWGTKTPQNKKPFKPKKKDFTPFKRDEAYFAFLVTMAPEIRGYVTFESWTEVEFQIYGYTPEEIDYWRNNHPIAKALFESLDAVKRWGNGGGQLIRCDGEVISKTYGKAK